MSDLPGHIELQPGEEVLAVIRPWRLIVFWKYLVTLGLYHFWWKRDVVAVTSRRVLTARGFILSKFERSLPLTRIQDVTRTRKLFWAYIEFSTAGGELGTVRWGPYGPRAAGHFAEAIFGQITPASAG